jgi:DNA repair protein RecO
MDKIKGIIIRTTDYREKDKIIDIFTPNGIVTATAKGVRSQSAKLRSACTIMTFGEFIFGAGAGNILSGADCIDNFFDSWGNSEKNAAVSFCFELVEKSFRNADETGEEFVFLLKIMREINYGEAAPIASALRFFVFCADRCGVDYSVVNKYNENAGELLETFSKCEPDEVGILPYSPNRVSEAVSLLHNVYKDFLGVRINALKLLVEIPV